MQVGVDDVAANEANIISLLHGSYGNVRHTVGSRVKLQLRRNGKTFEINLHRAAGDQFAALNDGLAFVHEQQDRISSSNMSEGDMISVCAGNFIVHRFRAHVPKSSCLFVTHKFLQRVQISRK